jgi:hypothetical protein
MRPKLFDLFVARPLINDTPFQGRIWLSNRRSVHRPHQPVRVAPPASKVLASAISARDWVTVSRVAAKSSWLSQRKRNALSSWRAKLAKTSA